MASVKKLPSGSWRAQASHVVNGKRIVRSFTVSPKECANDSRKAKALAELKASEWLATFEENRICNLTVRKALENYIEDHASVLSPNSVRGYRQYIPYFDDISGMRVDDVRSQDIGVEFLVIHYLYLVLAQTELSILQYTCRAAGRNANNGSQSEYDRSKSFHAYKHANLS